MDVPMQMGAVYMVDGRAYRLCACSKLDSNCPRGNKRVIQTAGYASCMVPTPDVILAVDGVAK